MALNFLSKLSPESKPPQVRKSLELASIVIVTDVVIGRFSGGLKMIGSCNCPITGV